MSEMETAARQIIALAYGHPGPFLEDDEGFFGAKRVNPSMKNAKMEVDCGGAMISKAAITYGQADEIVAATNISDLDEFIRRLFDGKARFRVPDCYWKPKSGVVFHGDMMWAVYAYLTSKGVLKLPDPHGGIRGMDSYHNGYEYLYDKLLKRLEAVGAVIASGDKYGERRWFKLPTA